jgi:hypothetical protein
MDMFGLLAVLSSFRFQYSSEDELQRGIAKALDAKSVSYLREHRLDAKDRPDFFIDGICLECKVDGSTQSLLRQVQRYALHTEVRGVIVVTNRTRHLKVGGELNGKPVVVYLVTSL